jgi:uncharacterized protein
MMDADRNPSPWHRGEREVHRRLGISEAIEAIGGHNIRPFMPDQHRLFFAQLPFMLVGSVDRTGRPWASLLSGSPGFVQSPDPRLLHVAALPAPGDPLVDALVPGGRVGMLGIELPTRRRNRVNGRIAAADDKGFTLAVEQSFGNCPQYIRTRRHAGLSPGHIRLAMLDTMISFLWPEAMTQNTVVGAVRRAQKTSPRSGILPLRELFVSQSVQLNAAGGG